MEVGDSGGAGPLVFICGQLGSFLCSWAVIFIHGRGRCVQGACHSWVGVVIINEGPSLSLGNVICGHGHCLWGWVVICSAMSLFMGAGCC